MLDNEILKKIIFELLKGKENKFSFLKKCEFNFRPTEEFAYKGWNSTYAYLDIKSPTIDIKNKIDREIKVIKSFLSEEIDFGKNYHNVPYVLNIKSKLSLKENNLEDGFFVKTYMEKKLDEEILSHKFISEQINKADKKIKDADYSGAITNSRTLIEQVLKELNGKLNLGIEYKGNLPKLYKEVSTAMDIKAESNSLDSIKKIVSGFVTTVDGISTLRNEASDAHGREINPERHHAKLAANCSLTICDFLLDSYEYQSKK